jgi:hypothetical protein
VDEPGIREEMVMTDQEQKDKSAWHIIDHLHPDTQVAVRYVIERAKIEEGFQVAHMLQQDYELGIQEERKRILDILIANCNTYHTALMGCECSVQIELIS